MQVEQRKATFVFYFPSGSIVKLNSAVSRSEAKLIWMLQKIAKQPATDQNINRCLKKVKVLRLVTLIT